LNPTDVLQQFNVPSTSTAKSAQSNTQAAEQNEVEVDDEDFAKQFAAEMEAFMKTISDPTSTTADSLDPKVAHEAEALRKVWEQIMINDLEGNEETSTDVPSGTTTTKADGASGSKDPFQKAVKQAMEKLKESDDSNKASLFIMFVAHN
jgi:peroxin-19